MRKFLSTTGGKLALTAGVLGVGGAMAGLGTFATFTSTTSASQSVTAGTVTIALGAPGALTNRLAVNATGVVPGDTIQRSFDLANTGNQNLASVALTTIAAPSTLLDTDSTNGLQMVIDKCSTAWSETPAGSGYTYTCAGGAPSSVVASRAVIGSAIAMSNLSSLTNGGIDHLRLTLTLPATAGNTFQGLSSTVAYAFTGTQRNSTNQ